jgi:hypothetical protein
MTVEGGPVPSATSTLDWRGLDIKPTINFSNGTPGAGSYTALRISTTETALPTGSNYLIRALSGAAASTERFAVTNTGEMSASGISADGSGKVVCIKSDGFLGTCSSVVGAGGTCTCG